MRYGLQQPGQSVSDMSIERVENWMQSICEIQFEEAG